MVRKRDRLLSSVQSEARNSEQEAGKTQIHQEIEDIAALIQNIVKQKAGKAQPQDEYNAKYDALVARYEKAVAQYNKLEAEIEKRNSKAQQIARFIDQRNNALLVLGESDSQWWALMVEKGTVNSGGSILSEFLNGKGTKVKAK